MVVLKKLSFFTHFYLEFSYKQELSQIDYDYLVYPDTEFIQENNTNPYFFLLK